MDRHKPARVNRRGTLGLVLAGATAIGILSAPGSMAYLQVQRSTDSVSLQTGSAALTVSGAASAAPLTLAPNGTTQNVWSDAPGYISNEGTVPLALTVDITHTQATAANFAGNVRFTVWSSTTTCHSGYSADSVWEGSALTADDTVIGVVQPGAQVLLCALAGLPTETPVSAQDSPNSPFIVNVTGSQVQP